MTPEQFCYWLRGFTELFPSKDKDWAKNWHPDGEQWNTIQKHLESVFENRIMGQLYNRNLPDTINLPYTPYKHRLGIVC